MPTLAVAHIASVGLVVLGAGLGRPWVVGIAAAGYVAVVASAAFGINQPLWGGSGTGASRAEAARRNVRLLAFAYAWGALALLAAYGLSGIRWQHGWQYGAGMALVAAALMTVAHRLGGPSRLFSSPATLRLLSTLNASHGIAAAGALAWLIGSGKLASTKGDWVANLVFLAGGALIVVLAAVAWRTDRTLGRDRAAR
jgi:hypothetical protein